MDDFSTSSLSESKNEWCARLLNVLTPTIVQGLKSINLPLGQVKVTRPVSELAVIIRTCTSINMLTQSKKRIFEKEKYEYTLRSINSILKSINQAKKVFQKINFKVTVIDHNSSKKNLNSIKKLLDESGVNNEILNLDINEFKESIIFFYVVGKKTFSISPDPFFRPFLHCLYPIFLAFNVSSSFSTLVSFGIPHT